MDLRDETGGNKPKSKREQDIDDLANESSGRFVGRMARFLPEDARPEAQRSKKEKSRDALTRLAMLMQNAKYAALYRETVDLVRDHAVKAEAGLESSHTALSAAGQALETLTDKAAKLHPSGEPVFRDENGNAVRADGTPLTPDEAASVVWPDDAPSYEEYLQAKTAYAEAQAQFDAWRNYQLYLGTVQNRLDDSDNPPTADELKVIQKRIQSMSPESQNLEQKTVVSPVDPTLNAQIEKPIL